VGLGLEEGDGGGVVWGWVGCVDSEVLLESSYGSTSCCFFFSLVRCCREEREGEEENGSLKYAVV